jgi:hypothetical protein
VISPSTPLNVADDMNTMLISMSVGGGDPSLINKDSSSSRGSISSSEVMSGGVFVFSFTLHSCSSFPFSVASSLNFYTLIRWILLCLGVSPRGHQRGTSAVPGTLVIDVLFRSEPRETGWSGSTTTMNWPRLLSWSLSSRLGPSSVLLCCSLLWTLLRAMLHLVIGRSFAPPFCLTLGAP